MKNLIFILALFFAGCSVSQPSQNNPCQDPKFLELKAKDLNALTIREYDYMKTKEQECEHYQALQNVDNTVTTVILEVLALGVLTTLTYIILTHH